MYKTYLLPLGFFLLSACGLQINSSDGGQVVSSDGQYQCTSSAGCTIVINPGDSFAATFVAQPQAGYQFDHWQGWPCDTQADATCIIAVSPQISSSSTYVAHITAHFTTDSAAGLGEPLLPSTSYLYADADINLPVHLTNGNGPGPSVPATDNTPANNPVTNAGATLGRVLFYDKRLSQNNTVACASCHQQQHGFSDPQMLSTGFAGGATGRHSMGLANARYYQRGHFFWDERADTLEDQVLLPIQDPVEMGMTLIQLEAKLANTDFYPALFAAAFGDEQITSERIALALAQFVRALVSYRSRFDQAFTNGIPNFAATFTAEEELGRQLFAAGGGPGGQGRNLGCAACHGTAAQVSDNVHNNGLDANITDAGAGNGRFKAPSLRNIAVRPPYMHDGRFESLLQVIEFYDSGVQANPNLDNRLRAADGQPRRLNLSEQEKAALLAFLNTLTDTAMLNDPKFSDPFSSN